MISPDEVPPAVAAFRAAAFSTGHAIPDDIVAAGIEAAVSAVAGLRADKAMAQALLASRPATALDAEQYKQLLTQDSTVSLEQFKAMEQYDPNAFWRLESGHHQNLLDAALEQIDVLARALETAVSGDTKR